jgi:hypothetical protein
VVDAPSADIAKLADLTGDAYATAKKEFIDKNGADAWRDTLNGKAPAVKTDAPAKPVTETAKTNGHAAEEGEPGEITINADGKPVDKATGRFVPHSAYMRVKGEAKEAKTQSDTLVRSVVQLQEKLANLLEPQQQQTQQAKPDVAPDPEEDVFGAIKWALKKMADVETRLTKTSTETNATLENTDMRERFVADAQKFTTKEPAFAQAYQHVIDGLHKELEVEGMTDAAERGRMIAENIRDRAVRLMKANKSPAEAIWAIAQSRGFQAKPAVDPAKEKEEQSRAEIDRLNKTKEATASLSGAGAGGGLEGLTLQKLASLTGDAYGEQRRAYIGKHGESAWRKLIGG